MGLVFSITCVLGCVVALAPFARAVEPGAEPDRAPAPTPSVRLLDDESGLARLQTPVRVFESASGDRVTLVGVSHVGTGAYYAELQQLLDQHQLVLYEGVGPDWRDVPHRASHRLRMWYTRVRLESAGAMLIEHARAQGAPLDRDDWLAQTPSYQRRVLETALTDAWGRSVGVVITPGGGGPARFTLTSLGADGRPGGQGASRDDVVAGFLPETTGQRDDMNAIQRRLAHAAGLRFQIDEIDYSSERWVNSDATAEIFLAVDTPDARETGQFPTDEVASLLTGESALARLVGAALGLVERSAHARFTLRLVMMETVAMADRFVEAEALGEGVHERLVGQRNAIVIADLRRELRAEPESADVAIFYGAAHLPDFADRLRSMGFEQRGVSWVTAMQADPGEINADPAWAQRLRATVRSMLERQLNDWSAEEPDDAESDDSDLPVDETKGLSNP